MPKAHTPFQRLAQTPAKEVKRSLARVERGVRSHGIGVKAESPTWAEVQGTLARGDRRIADALVQAERPSPARWREALGAGGLSLPELLGERPAGEPLPWAFIHTGIRLPPTADSDLLG